jgi:hypothetical protein
MKSLNHRFIATAVLLAVSNAPAQPSITLQPNNQSVSLGASVSFRVFATSTNSPVVFHWRLDGTNLLMATNSSLTVNNVQTTNAGNYDAVMTDNSQSVTSRVAKLDVDPTFTKITTGTLVAVAGTGTACGWGDYDNDGFMDLFVTSAFNVGNRMAQVNRLFHNNGNGTFTEITIGAPVSEARDWRGGSWVDYDNDGHLDLFVTSTDDDGFVAQNELFRNNGDGTFTKMTPQAAGAIVPGGGGSEGPVWADYDNDGFVDVFVARYGPDWLFHNDGDGRFSRVTNSLPPDNQTNYAAAWSDYNNDGLPDLFVCSKDPPTNRLYLNLGGGAFAQVTGGDILKSQAHAFNCGWGDYDNDGYQDLFVNNDFCPVGPCNEPNFLFHNNGDGTFTRVTNSAVGSIISDVSGAVVAWGDYDNDGYLDLFLPNTPQSWFYHNNGDGTFTRILTGSLVNDGGINPVSCAWGDYDNDGFLDLVVIRGADVAVETNLLYHNNGNSNAWIKVRLVGLASNRSAIGAKVRVKATIRGKNMWQLREINTGSGYGAGALEAHFGLGDATNIDQLRIEWPSGIVQNLTNVAPRQILTVVEHQAGPVAPFTLSGALSSTNQTVALTVTGNPGALYVFEASTNLINWTKIGVRSNATGTVQFVDAKATALARRFYRVTAP